MTINTSHCEPVSNSYFITVGNMYILLNRRGTEACSLVMNPRNSSQFNSVEIF
jgi:hypothetical protein